MFRLRQRPWLVRAILALAILAVGASALLAASSACSLRIESGAREQVDAEALKPLWEVWGILDDDFVDRESLDPEKLRMGATRGLLALLAGPDDPSGSRLPANPIKPPRGTPKDLQPLWDAWVWLYETHPESATRPEPATLAQAAIRGLLKEVGDPHTAYISPDRYRIEAQAFEGNYQGIGAEVYKRGERFILNPMPGGPAKEAGMLAGDILLAVDGESPDGWTVFEAVTRIRGPKNSIVRLRVQHLEAEGPALLEIRRGIIKMESVFWRMLEDKIAYVRLSAFYGNTDESLEAVLKEIMAKEPEGLILDLRNNPGGFLSVTVTVTGFFLEEGLITYEINGKGRRKDHYAKNNGLVTQLPMAVLVNQFSASGSEVLAGALQDHERATVVGVGTFGKGSVNLTKGLSDGGGLYYSIARWYTPNDRLIEGDGLEPDVTVAASAGSSGDLQLAKALEVLAQQIR
jgi:carboxyl-terminal processing protease